MDVLPGGQQSGVGKKVPEPAGGVVRSTCL